MYSHCMNKESADLESEHSPKILVCMISLRVLMTLFDGCMQLCEPETYFRFRGLMCFSPYADKFLLVIFKCLHTKLEGMLADVISQSLLIYWMSMGLTATLKLEECT